MRFNARRQAFGGGAVSANAGTSAALGYLDFRHGGKWRAGHPKMVAWLDKFAAEVPAFAETAPPPNA